MHQTITIGTRRSWATLKLAAQKFMHIDGGQRAAAFAYSAFFALFPLIVLFVTAATMFMNRPSAAAAVITYVERVVPISGEMQTYVFDTLSRVIKSRGQASVVALAILIWVAAQFFTTLIQARLALLFTISGAVLAGIGVPLMGKISGGLFKTGTFLPLAYKFWLFVLPWLIVFLSLAFFYKLAPHRRTRYSEVWLAALCATLLLHAAQSLFVLYLKHIASLSALYGAFGGIMALLMWIYLSGVIFIFCACLCAAQAATKAGQ